MLHWRSAGGQGKTEVLGEKLEQRYFVHSHRFLK